MEKGEGESGGAEEGDEREEWETTRNDRIHDADAAAGDTGDDVAALVRLSAFIAFQLFLPQSYYSLQ